MRPNNADRIKPKWWNVRPPHMGCSLTKACGQNFITQYEIPSDILFSYSSVELHFVQTISYQNNLLYENLVASSSSTPTKACYCYCCEGPAGALIAKTSDLRNALHLRVNAIWQTAERVFEDRKRRVANGQGRIRALNYGYG